MMETEPCRMLTYYVCWEQKKKVILMEVTLADINTPIADEKNAAYSAESRKRLVELVKTHGHSEVSLPDKIIQEKKLRFSYVLWDTVVYTVSSESLFPGIVYGYTDVVGGVSVAAGGLEGILDSEVANFREAVVDEDDTSFETVAVIAGTLPSLSSCSFFLDR
ncbi:hypothetical protein FQA39_LY05345 [Lamprigera yunnana]|nr:hypothetical protein FQA39_LY05345 [Lamprigera yunnana]